MATTGSRPVDTGGLLVGVSALFVVVGAFLGWFTIPIGDTLGSIDGLDLVEFGSPGFNGIVTITLAAGATVLALFLPDVEVVNGLTAISGLCIELVAATFLLAPDVAVGTAIQMSSNPTLSNTGVGVYLTLVGGLGILLGGVLSYRR